MTAVPLTTNFQVASLGVKRQSSLNAALTAAFAARPGRWHVQFIGDRGDDAWEVRLSGPAVETSGYVDAAADPESLAALVAGMAE